MNQGPRRRDIRLGVKELERVSVWFIVSAVVAHIGMKTVAFCLIVCITRQTSVYALCLAQDSLRYPACHARQVDRLLYAFKLLLEAGPQKQNLSSDVLAW